MNQFNLLRLCLFAWPLLVQPGAQSAAIAPETDRHGDPAGLQTDNYFADEVWPKVAARSCLECHKPGGDADDSKLILQDPARDSDPTHAASLEHNRAAFEKMALMRKNDQSRLLLKATGGLKHGGEEVLKPDSTGYRILAEFVRRAGGPQIAPATVAAKAGPSHFFDGIAMMDDRRLLRRATLSLAGRLPTPAELAAVEQQGLAAFQPVLDGVMKEEAFYDRLAEAFNDIFLIRGFTGLPEQVLFTTRKAGTPGSG